MQLTPRINLKTHPRLLCPAISGLPLPVTCVPGHNLIHYVPSCDFSRPTQGPLERKGYEGSAAWIARPGAQCTGNRTLPKPGVHVRLT